MKNDPLEPSMTLNLGKSIGIVKFHLDKLDFSVPMKTLAIEKVARMETHNSLTKKEHDEHDDFMAVFANRQKDNRRRIKDKRR